MKPERTRRPEIEDLEARWTPSATPLAMAAASTSATGLVHAQTRQPVGRALPIRGTLNGAYVLDPATLSIEDGPARYYMSGEGRVGVLGRVTAEGQFASNAFVREPAVSIVLSLHNPRGGITLRLTPPAEGSVSSGRARWEASIIDGYGAYSSVRGIGTAHVSLTPYPVTGGRPGVVEAGGFQLALALRPPVR